MSIMEFVLSKAGGTLIVITLFAGVCYLLRYLYGPKGKYRDPRWDILNEQARMEERIAVFAKKLEGSMPEIDIAKFFDYTRPFFVDDTESDPYLGLKQEHTLYVLENARHIAEGEDAFSPPDMRRALLLAALYHDVGRFEQFRRHKTFVDALSCDHGLMGARVLRRERLLDGEKKAVRRMALTAVACHNRHVLPAAFQGPGRTVVDGLRDADKLDIFRIMRENLAPGAKPDPVVLMHLKDEPGNYSPVVLQALEEGRMASFLEMRYYNDFRLLLCSWLYDFHFVSSRKLARESGNLEAILAGFDGAPEVLTKVRDLVEPFFVSTPSRRP